MWRPTNDETTGIESRISRLEFVRQAGRLAVGGLLLPTLYAESCSAATPAGDETPTKASILDERTVPRFQAELERYLETARQKHAVPAVAAACVVGNRLVGAAVQGVRAAGTSTPVTMADRFHIESHARSLTATLLATFVEEGKISWETQVAEVFPEVAAEMHPENRKISLAQLLTQSSGLANDELPVDPELANGWVCLRMSLLEQRLLFLRKKLAAPPDYPAGTKQQHVHGNYILAAAIAERLGSAAWEDLLRQRLLKPAGLGSFGFGPPGSPSPDKLNEPRQHAGGPDKRQQVYHDNPPVCGGSCIVHCSIVDFARYVSLHLFGELGIDSILKASTFRALHTRPKSGTYAFGWHVTGESNGLRTLEHTGWNGLSSSASAVVPTQKVVVVVAGNATFPAEESRSELLRRLSEQFGLSEHERVRMIPVPDTSTLRFTPVAELVPTTVKSTLRREDLGPADLGRGLIVGDRKKRLEALKPVRNFLIERTQPAFQKYLEQYVENVRRECDMAAISVAVVHGKQLVAAVAQGRRRFDDPTAVTPDDQFTIASCTKAMVSFAFASLVEKRQVSWDRTVSDFYPELVSKIHPQLRKVTLRQLLDMTSGLTIGGAPPDLDWGNPWVCLRMPVVEQRYFHAQRSLADAPGFAPGSDQQYYSINYTIATSILERVCDAPWEEIARERVFVPLGLSTADFGPPGRSPLKLDQPRQHGFNGQGKKVALYSDISPVGGCVCLSVKDFAKWGLAHVYGERGVDLVLRASTYRTLHTPPPGMKGYALGWGTGGDDSKKGLQFGHNGSNCIGGAIIDIHSGEGLVVASQTNDGIIPAGKNPLADIHKHVFEIAPKWLPM